MRNLMLSLIRVIRGLIILVSMIGFSSFAYAQKTIINVLTYNIRFANPDDAPNTWDQRKEKVFSLVRDAKPDIFGLQEVLNEQVSDFEKAFPGFTRIGVGRDDGKESGEYSPLLFNSKKYNLVSSGTFWLSQTPSVAGSRGWDAACNRVVTWVQLKDKKSKALFFVFCTHFDHMGEIARRNSANLLIHAVDSLAGYNPVIVMGDFNAIPGSEPYNLITDFSNRLHLKDARVICADLKGPEYTFTGFKVGAQRGTRIDYIFAKNNVQVLSFNVNESNNGEYYPSDHLPVNATMKIY
jgi:endonuclease/exonuclease/phosphatase family metal-dependent hydrolase